MPYYQFQLTPLTPIHIGTGEGLEPFEYVVAGNTLYRFTLDDFVLTLAREEQARFVDLVGRSVPATRRFVAEHVGEAVEAARFTATVSTAARALYDGRMEGGAAHPEVAACIRTSDQAYVPGSSLKGALRTALLYHAMEKDNPERDARKLEGATFGFEHWRVQQDPFRAFKVGDGEPLAERTRVRAVAVNTQRGGQWSEDVAMLVETVPGVVSDNVTAVSEHAVTFDESFYRYHERAFRLDPGAVLAACRDFYHKHLAEEHAFVQGLPATAAAYESLAGRAEELPDNACLVRLAWGSGRDATTVAYGLRGSRSPASRRLTADGFPLGWAELAMFDAEGQPLAAEAMEVEIPAPEPRKKERKEGPQRLGDLQIGMMLEGRVTNTVRFGAFVDVGLDKEGLIHISKLAEGFVERTEAVVRRGNRVRVEVIRVDLDKRQFGLRLVEVL